MQLALALSISAVLGQLVAPPPAPTARQAAGEMGFVFWIIAGLVAIGLAWWAWESAARRAAKNH